MKFKIYLLSYNKIENKQISISTFFIRNFTLDESRRNGERAISLYLSRLFDLYKLQMFITK